MRSSVVTILCIAVLGGLAIWFFATHEQVTEQEYIGFQGEARANEFLAAEYLLAELGYGTDSRSSLTPSSWLPDTGDTIVKRVSSDVAVDEELELLTGWIENGGHLVLLPPRSSDALTDEFLDYLGVEFRRIPAEDTPELPDRVDDDNVFSLLDYEVGEFRVVPYYEDMFDAKIEDDLGIVAARTQWGTGYLTVVANARYFRNASLDEPENARLLLDVVAGFIDPGTIWFVYNSAFPSLWEIIWASAPFAVLAAAMALALWIWSVTPKFGPAMIATFESRRSIIEHIRAAGNFVWRNRSAGVLTGSSINAMLHEAEARHPGIGRLSRRDQATRIARITNLPAEWVFEALVGHDNPRPRDFTHHMQSLQGIRKEL